MTHILDITDKHRQTQTKNKKITANILSLGFVLQYAFVSCQSMTTANMQNNNRITHINMQANARKYTNFRPLHVHEPPNHGKFISCQIHHHDH